MAHKASSLPFSRTIFSTGSQQSYVAREIRRYIWLTTGSWPAIIDTQFEPSLASHWLKNASLHGSYEAVVLTLFGSSLQEEVLSWLEPKERNDIKKMWEGAAKGEHSLSSYSINTNNSIIIAIGFDKMGLHHAAYSLAEHMGVRFELHGDILPDPTGINGLPLSPCASAPLPPVRLERVSPIFEYRGLQPFHDFPEGPDWWNENMYKKVITQISKMKMNFIGLHTYPYSTGKSTGHNEPTVWVGLKSQLADDGTVKSSYPTSYANTMRNEWGYASLPTSNYSWGTSRIFETDCWAPPPTTPDSCPWPDTPNSSNAIFERTANMLQAAFSYGTQIGVKSCVGTETPLSFPKPPPPKCTVNPSIGCWVDYDSPKRVFPYTVTINDPSNDQEWCAGQCALQNYTYAGVEYSVACFCSNKLPSSSSVAMSECNMKCHHNPNEDCGGSWRLQVYNFSCQPSASISSRDYYEGMFTRLMKRIPALDWYWIWTPENWEWGHLTVDSPQFKAAIADLNSAMSAHDEVGAKFDMATNGWVVGPLPDRSIFDKVLPNSWDAITSIDLNTGHNPVDPSYLNVTRHKKWAIPWMEDDPDLTAPQLWVNRTLIHMENAKKYGCNGLLGIHWRTRAVGPQIAAMAQKSWNFSLTSQAFWLDWVSSHFGLKGQDCNNVASVFNSIDSFHMPTVVAWSGGPGKMRSGCNHKNFTFVSRLESFGNKVTGALNKARFSYWLASFKYMSSIDITSCAWKEFNDAMATVKAAPGDQQKHLAETIALPARIRLVNNATTLIGWLQQTLSTPGELGTYMNIESHSFIDMLTKPGKDLETYLQTSLPPQAQPPSTYGQTNPAMIIVPVVRNTLSKKELFVVRTLVLSAVPCTKVNIFVRKLGSTGPFNQTPLSKLAIDRDVFEKDLNNPSTDFEWYVKANCGTVQPVFPVGAPTITQTVVLI